MGMITSVFCLVFVFAYFTNILEIINGVKIVNIADAQVEGTIFIIWNVFVIAKYYLCILFPTSMNNRQSERINKSKLFLCVVNTLIELFYNMVLPRCVVVCNLLDFLLINEIQYRRYY